tara:strand:- start:328 stop:1179 length:852 start_codon:yes stop_codon:yes gene_type:complete
MSMSKLFVIGNGESRKNFDLEQLRPHGKIYGCNGLHRDFTPDALTCVDPGITHEVYDNRYAKDNVCYYRGWTSLPGDLYEQMKNTHIEDMSTRFGSEPKLIESERYEGSTEFVIHGSTALMQDKLLEEQRPYKGIGANVLFISWLHPKDNVTRIDDIMNLNDGKTGDCGWSAGPTAMSIGCVVEKPDEVYMIGCDLYSNTDNFNNLYKSTLHYERDDIAAVIPVNWLTQYSTAMVINSNTDFYKVNEKPLGTDNINKEIPEWNDLLNLKYITQEELINKYLTK